MRDSSVAHLQDRFRIDLPHAERVQAVAKFVHESLAPEASPDLKRELDWAAAVHELGMMVSHHDHHRHSAYLLGNVDAPGFSQSQQRRLAALVLGQRGGLRKLDEALNDEHFTWQLLSLRLAALLCHARRQPELDALHLRRHGRMVTLTMAQDWARAHPRTLYLLEEEQASWERQVAARLVLNRG
jgi:exopolyphosphatase/guanosine-5'-triphosphate,3'-diphosphate pyrophosphatase